MADLHHAADRPVGNLSLDVLRDLAESLTRDPEKATAGHLYLALIGEIDRTDLALRRYGEHDPRCGFRTPAARCTCGLHQALYWSPTHANGA